MVDTLVPTSDSEILFMSYSALIQLTRANITLYLTTHPPKCDYTSGGEVLDISPYLIEGLDDLEQFVPPCSQVGTTYIVGV